MINAYTRIYGIIGHPISHSFSPIIHNPAFQACNINAVYVAFDAENIADAIKGVRSLNIAGASITIPHKISIIPHLDEVSELAQKIGSVNTIYWENNRLKGDNTDAYGFFESLSQHSPVTGKTITVIGSGGSSLAVCFALYAYDQPARLYIIARNQESRRGLRNQLLTHFPEAVIETFNFESLSKILPTSDIIINTTPVGMFPNENQTPFEESLIPHNSVIMDIIYNPMETKLLQIAKTKHCTTINGADMLLYQAMRQFEIWTGEKPPMETMKKALQKHLKTVSVSGIGVG